MHFQLFWMLRTCIRVLNVLLESIDLILLMFHAIISISIIIKNINFIVDINFDTICWNYRDIDKISISHSTTLTFFSSTTFPNPGATYPNPVQPTLTQVQPTLTPVQPTLSQCKLPNPGTNYPNPGATYNRQFIHRNCNRWLAKYTLHSSYAL